MLQIETCTPECGLIRPSLVGVAKGVTHCGAESPSLRDPNTWSIEISKNLLYKLQRRSPFTASKFKILVCTTNLTG